MIESSLIVRFTAPLSAEMFSDANTPRERLHRLQAFHAPQIAALRERLAPEGVEVEELASMGALIIRGAPDTLERLRAPGGALDVEGLAIADEATFTSSG